MNLGSVRAGIVALVVVVPLFGAGNVPVEIAQPVQANEELTSWSTRTGWWLPSSHYPKQAVYHDGRALVFVPDPHSVWRTYVYEAAPSATPVRVGEISLHHSLRGSFLPVSHAGDLYAFASDSSNGGEVHVLDTVTWEQTVVAEGATVGEYSAGVSTGEAIYIFPGSAAALDPAQIWRFDPVSRSLTATGVAVPFSGSAKDARHATALWTGSEVVLVGGNNQEGRVFTWTPGDERMKVLPFDYDGSQDSLNGHAIWTGASIYLLGEPQARDIIRITLHPPSFQKVSIRLVEDADGGDVVWDGSDAYIFTSRNGIIRFHPWESDLPRITLGQDESLFSASLYAMGEGSMPSALSFCEDDLIRLIEHLEKYDPGIVGPLNPTPGLPDGLHDEYVELKEFLNDEVGLDWCIDGSVSLDNSQQEAYGGGFVQAFTTGLGADIPLPIPAGKAKTFFQGLQLLNAIGSFGNWATAGHEFFFQQGCAEQQHQLSGRMIIDYDFKGRVITGSAGAEVTAAWLRVDAGVAAPLGRTLGPAWEANLEELSTWGAVAWVSEREVDIQSKQMEIPFYGTKGLKNTYVRMTSGASNLGLLGVSYHNADAGSEDRGFDIHRIKYEFDDESPPQITTQTDGPGGREGWFLGPVAVSAVGSDAQSCINLVRLSMGDVTLDEAGDPWHPMVQYALSDDGTHLVTSTARNMKAVQTTEETSVRIDTVEPGSSHSLSGIGQNGWYRSCVDLTINTVDSMSGPAEQFSDRPGDGEVEAGSREFCADGIEPFTYWAWDVAGNVEEPKHGPILKIDRTPPVGATGGYDGEEGEDEWYRSCVQVPVTGWDALSGFDFAEYAVNDGPFQEESEVTICDEGINELHVIAHDVAGNQDVQRTWEVKIDLTPPSVSVSAPSVTASRDYEVDWEASDGLSHLTGAIGLEYRHEPLVGEPSEWQALCAHPVSGPSATGSCRVEDTEIGSRICVRAAAQDRAGNTAVSPERCTAVGLL